MKIHGQVLPATMVGDRTTGYVAYVKDPDKQLTYDTIANSFDAARTIELLKSAIYGIESGDGHQAVAASGEAWARILAFHSFKVTQCHG